MEAEQDPEYWESLPGAWMGIGGRYGHTRHPMSRHDAAVSAPRPLPPAKMHACRQQLKLTTEIPPAQSLIPSLSLHLYGGVEGVSVNSNGRYQLPAVALTVWAQGNEPGTQTSILSKFPLSSEPPSLTCMLAPVPSPHFIWMTMSDRGSGSEQVPG